MRAAGCKVELIKLLSLASVPAVFCLIRLVVHLGMDVLHNRETFRFKLTLGSVVASGLYITTHRRIWKTRVQNTQQQEFRKALYVAFTSNTS